MPEQEFHAIHNEIYFGEEEDPILWVSRHHLDYTDRIVELLNKYGRS